MTLKILHLLDALNRGGAEIMSLDVCRNAHTAGLDMTFVASGGGDLENDFATSGVNFVRLQRRLPVDPALILQLRKIIIDQEVKIVHAQQAVEAIHLYLATRGTAAKCVMSLQNYILDTKNRIATKLILPGMDAICPVSESMLEWFRTEEGVTSDDRYFVLHNGVDPSRLKPTRASDAVSLHHDLGVAESDFLMGMVGNFYPDARKDQMTICKALPTVMSENQGSHFVFVGSVHNNAQDYFDRCVRICREAGISDRVHFVGKRADIPDVLRELDLFVFSSVQEGLPVAAVESLMLGVPMLVSDIPPLLEVIGHGKQQGPVAEIFRTGDHEDLAAKLKDLIGDRERLSEMGEKARVQTLEQFGIDAHIKKLKTLYEKLAAS